MAMKRLVLGFALPLWVAAGCGKEEGATEVRIPKIDSVSAAREVLSAALHVQTRPYSTYEFGRAKDPNAVSFVIDQERAAEVLPRIRASLGPGLIAFLGTTRWLVDEQHEGVEVVVAQGASQFDILRTARSNAFNCDMGTGDLIRRLRKYDREHGIDIFQAETDTIQFRLKAMPADPAGFARDLYAFCPDTVDQGVGSVAALEAEFTRKKTVFLWWDWDGRQAAAADRSHGGS
jgi:hypothetical protein